MKKQLLGPSGEQYVMTCGLTVFSLPTTIKPSCPIIPCIVLQVCLLGHVIISSAIRAVTLAGGAGVNIRATVWSGVAPASTPKGHEDFTDLSRTLGHTLPSLKCYARRVQFLYCISGTSWRGCCRIKMEGEFDI